jgi:predicted GNAT family acetyltransferase
MATVVVDNPDEKRFEISVDGVRAGFTEYRAHGATHTFFHTEIDPAFEGKGLGSKLIRGALDAMRGRGNTVIPTCPFVRRFIDDHAEYADLVTTDT